MSLKDVTPHSLGVAVWSGDCFASQIQGSTEIAKRLLREGGKDGKFRASLIWNSYDGQYYRVVCTS